MNKKEARKETEGRSEAVMQELERKKKESKMGDEELQNKSHVCVRVKG